MRQKSSTLISLMLPFLIIQGCAQSNSDSSLKPQKESQVEINQNFPDLLGDPEEEKKNFYVYEEDILEPFNRFNDELNREKIYPTLDKTLKYTLKQLPDPVRQVSDNFARNIADCGSIVSALLQAKWEKSWDFTASCFGNFFLGPLWTRRAVQEDFGIPSHRPETMTQVLAHYGMPAGPNITYPLIGHSDLRDTIGMGLTIVTNPFSIFAPGISGPLYAHNFVEKYEESSQANKGIKILQANTDPYVSGVETWRGYMEGQIKN